jgi:hypothetical protein
MKKRKITLKTNFIGTLHHCVYCGGSAESGGLEYADEETGRVVCVPCVEKHAPGLIPIHKEAESYAQATREMIETAADPSPSMMNDLFGITDFEVSNNENLLATFSLHSGGLEINRCLCFYTPQGDFKFQLPENVDFEPDQWDPTSLIRKKLLDAIEVLKAKHGSNWNYNSPF